MTETRKSSPLAPFAVRSFRFQWPADLMASWGFEMETLILGWYILTETDSVILLTVFGALRFIGTLLSPWYGVAGDRVGRRKMMYTMRSFMGLLAIFIMVLALLDMLTPYHVFAIAFLAGLVQPSDIVMRNSLIGDSMPAGMLMNAMSISRTAQDSARIFGALAGATLFSILGIGLTYIVVVCVYALSVLCTLGVSKAHPRIDRQTATPGAAGGKPSHFQELKEGLVYIWNTPAVLAIMWLAFLANLTAFPVSHGLMPFVARDVLHLDENGLGQLLAAFSAGAVIGSLILAWTRSQRHSARLTLVNLLLWYVMLVVFVQFDTKLAALITLLFMGVVHGMAMVSMAVALLGVTDEMVRGRVMGVRMLAVYGVPLGLLGSGVLIEALGFQTFVWIYASIGILFTLAIALKWRTSMWPSGGG